MWRSEKQSGTDELPPTQQTRKTSIDTKICLENQIARSHREGIYVTGFKVFQSNAAMRATMDKELSETGAQSRTNSL